MDTRIPPEQPHHSTTGFTCGSGAPAANVCAVRTSAFGPRAGLPQRLGFTCGSGAPAPNSVSTAPPQQSARGRASMVVAASAALVRSCCRLVGFTNAASPLRGQTWPIPCGCPHNGIGLACGSGAPAANVCTVRTYAFGPRAGEHGCCRFSGLSAQLLSTCRLYKCGLPLAGTNMAYPLRVLPQQPPPSAAYDSARASARSGSESFRAIQSNKTASTP